MEFNVGLFRYVFREVVCQVLLRWDILVCNDELILSHAIPDPVEAHIDGFAALLLDAVRGNSNTGNIFAHYDGRVLGIAHVVKSCAK